MPDLILIRNARAHNLKGVDLDLPRGKFIALTGVSGSGKSSLAVDTLFRWGERRYLEGLSPKMRAHLGGGARPEVDRIEGLPPTLCVPQDPLNRDPRATLASLADVLDYLRILWSIVGEPFCHQCDRPLARRSPAEVADAVAALPARTRVLLLAPLYPGVEDDPGKAVERARREGFVRVRVDGEVLPLTESVPDDAGEVAAVVDRIIVKDGLRTRLQDSVEVALRASGGTVMVAIDGASPDNDSLFSARFGCPRCDTSGERPTPATFSWWSPRGACPGCTGTGVRRAMDPEILVPVDDEQPLRRILDSSFRRLPPVERDAMASLTDTFLETEGAGPLARADALGRSRLETFLRAAIAPRLLALADGKTRAGRGPARALLALLPCADCGGRRLCPEARAVRLGGMDITQLLELDVAGALEALGSITVPGPAAEAADPLLDGVRSRLGILADLGLGYLALARPASTLSGGEAQRARLAAHLGGGLAGVLYVLDEPTAGLHPAETDRLLASLFHLRDAGNSLVVVEHDLRVIAAADHVVECGPGAGRDGGEVVFQGDPAEHAAADTPTGACLRGEHSLPPGDSEEDPFLHGSLTIKGARAHNLKGVDLRLPVGRLTAVVGVSGSGKSSLVVDVLLRALRRRIHGDPTPPGPHDVIHGMDRFRRAVEVDRTRVGGSARATPGTYVGAWGEIRSLLAKTSEARIRGFGPGRFSFNRGEGRCAGCDGLGTRTIGMHLLPDVHVTCEACEGRRFERETLEVKWRGQDAAQLLELTVHEALATFRNVPKIRAALDPMERVGLGYVPLGQPLDTLSGGESQRLRLAGELTGRTGPGVLLVIDEPSIGLHPRDVSRLATVLRDLAAAGTTLVVIDHDLELVRRADWVVEMGPGPGAAGGTITAQGSPAAIAASDSVTGSYLRTP